MTAPASQDTQDARIFALEERLAETIDIFGAELGELRSRLQRVERTAPAMSAGGTPVVTAHGGRPTPSSRRSAAAPRATPVPAPRRGGTCDPNPGGALRSSRSASLGDLIGGRVLAWAGGVTTLLGIALFLALAISHGWIGEEARVLLAGAVSLALLGGGARLHARRGRTEAAIAMTGAGVAGLFATLVVTSAVYELVPALVALGGAVAIGATATRLAIRWAGRAIAGIGLLGALAAPALLGAPAEWPTLAMMLVTAGFAVWIAARQGWAWLALATVAVCAPQWAYPMLPGWEAASNQGVAEDLFVLGAFAALGLMGATTCARGTAGDGGAARVPRAALATLVLSSVATGLVGYVSLDDAGGQTLAASWLTALALVHLGLGASRHPALAARMRGALLALGLVLADVAFALSFDGLVLALGWGAGAVAISALTRRDEGDVRDSPPAELGAGLQLSLALIRVLVDAPPSVLMSGAPELAAIASVASFTVACFACAALAPGEGLRRTVFAVAGLAGLAYLTATTLDGAALAAAWASEAGALVELARRRGERLAAWGGLAFGALAALYTLATIAPPTGLGGGEVALGEAAVALASLASLAWRARRLAAPGSRGRDAAGLAAAGAGLYMASLAVVTLPNGQVALSALWGATGVLALVCGLRLSLPALRNAALGLLLATIAKVFLYDLSTLESIARVVSFMVLGLLLLAGAFAYQRLRPPPAPDMREVHPSRR